MKESNQTVPEYILETSERITHKTKITDCIIPALLAVEVDLVVLSRECTKLEKFSGNIVNQLRELRLSALDMD